MAAVKLRRQAKNTRDYNYNVFVNCPYDRRYETLFDAIVFCIYDCGYLPRCALEVDDAARDRVGKIIDIIKGCKFAVSDLSRIELDPRTKLPRFNMPFELGLVLGIDDWSRRKRRPKVALILEKRSGQYRRFLSDLAGRDAKSHGERPKNAVTVLRDWLKTDAKGVLIPGADHIWKRFRQFEKDLPELCGELNLQPNKLIYPDYALVVEEWLQAQPF